MQSSPTKHGKTFAKPSTSTNRWVQHITHEPTDEVKYSHEGFIDQGSISDQGFECLLRIILQDMYYCMNLLSNLVSALQVIQQNTLYKMQVIDMGTRHYNSWGTIFSIILLNKPPTPTSTPLPNATKKYILTEVYSRLFPPSKTNRDEQFLSLGKYLRNCESLYYCGQAQFSNFHGK